MLMRQMIWISKTCNRNCGEIKRTDDVSLVGLVISQTRSNKHLYTNRARHYRSIAYLLFKAFDACWINIYHYVDKHLPLCLYFQRIMMMIQTTQVREAFNLDITSVIWENLFEKTLYHATTLSSTYI